MSKVPEKWKKILPAIFIFFLDLTTMNIFFGEQQKYIIKEKDNNTIYTLL